MKILAVSVALAMSGAANASILRTNSTNGSGEMFLTVWDKDAAQSYALDLGVRTIDFNADWTQTLSYDLSGDANFANFMNSSNNIVYTVAGADQSAWDILNYGFLTTVSSDFESVRISASTYSRIGGVSGTIDVMALNSNTDSGDVIDANFAANLSNFSLSSDTGYAGLGTWGSNLGGTAITSTANIDSSVAFYAALMDSDWFTPIITELPNVWTLTSAGQLTYAPVSAVPVPAAVWLFGSGLLGLVSVARRRKA